MKCPCCSGQDYIDCCKLIIEGKQQAKNPEQLMRSRYTAYATGDIDYIAKSMIGPALVDFDVSDTKRWSKTVRWIELEVHNAYIDEQDVNTGFVKFKAKYRDKKNKVNTLTELSEFKLINGDWYYFQGILDPKSED